MILAFVSTDLLRPVSLATGPVSDKTHKSKQSVHHDSHTLTATYYSVKENLKATLMLSNQGTSAMPIQISLFSYDGYQSDLPADTLQAHEVRAVDLGQHIRRGSNFEEGSLQIIYQGMPLELGGVVTLVNSARSLIFDEELTEPAKAFASARLEGVWWRPAGSTEVRLALTNTSNAQLSVSVATGKKDNGNSDATTMTLIAHETRVLSTEEHNDSNELELHGKAGGISIKHTGAPGSLTAYGFVQEPEKGFSNIIDFTDPQKVKTARLDGAGIRFETIANQPLSQVAVVRNVGTAPTTVQGRISYTLANGRQGIKKLVLSEIVSRVVEIVFAAFLLKPILRA
ncbi:MAG: hypothetical protein M3X11_12000 [Acidobacteriota bacterium]|nr:hypothetical protein [Acidobacteriota bacterium]